MKSCFWLPGFISFAICLASQALAQTNFTVLRSFGFAELSASDAASPVIDSKGVIYCTALSDQAAGGGAILRLLPGAADYEVIHRFELGVSSRPLAILLGSDELLYGITYFGGRFGRGTVFRLSKDGKDFEVILEVDNEPTLGSYPQALIEGTDGNLYGLTYGNDLGSLFKVGRSGEGFMLLHTFGLSGDGTRPLSLVEGSDGMIYGTTESGGTSGLGTMFRIGKNGAEYSVLRSFSNPATEGRAPNTILPPRNGFIYGTTAAGGAGNWGTVIRFNLTDGEISVLHHFQHIQGEGLWPSAIVYGEDDWLYGSTHYGGGTGEASVFKLRQDGTDYRVIRSSLGLGLDEINITGLTRNWDGKLVYTSRGGGRAGFGAILELESSGAGYRILASLQRTGGDGTGTKASLMAGSDNFLYGTTYSGGKWSRGTVFRMKKDGSGYQQLRSFGITDMDGRYPGGRLFEGEDGLVYGTTQNGGEYGPKATFGAGTIFRMREDGSEFQVIHTFQPNSADGRLPMSVLNQGQDGTIYGITYQGGTAEVGTLYRINPDGTSFQTLHHFRAQENDGFLPEAGVLIASDGMIYGSTTFGWGALSGCLYRLKPNGEDYEILHAFDWSVGDGQHCTAPLLEGSDGRLYGTTEGGGNAGHGTVFGMNKDGTDYLILRNFDVRAGNVDGRFPSGALAEGVGGALFGITQEGGVTGLGIVFRINKDGTGFQVLRHFGYSTVGYFPSDGLVKDFSGAMFGTTSGGGMFRFGTVYALHPEPTSWITSISLKLDGTINLRGRGAADRTYRLLTTQDLGVAGWSDMGTTVALPSGELRFDGILTPASPMNFFRIAAP